jgi:hypothetical protein
MAGTGKTFGRVPPQGMDSEGKKVKYGSNRAHYYDSICLEELRNTARNCSLPGWHLIKVLSQYIFKRMSHASTCKSLSFFPLGWN